MENIVKMENVFEYCDWLGVETRHPLVEVVDFSKIDRPLERFLHTFGFYAVFLKDIKCGDLVYGCQYYDYQEGTLVFAAPGQVFGVKGGAPVKPKGWALVFHPDLLRRTSLGREMKNYTFFSYEVNEALHLSEQERGIVIDCLKKIDNELQHAVDRHSKTLIAMNIELLLDYCVRFYERQFITRSEANNDILVRFENLVNDYFESDKPQTVGLPSVRWCAASVGELLRRPYQARDGSFGAGAYPAEVDRHCEGADFRYGQVGKRDCLRTGLQIPAALHAPVQEGYRQHSERVQDAELTPDPNDLKVFKVLKDFNTTTAAPERAVVVCCMATGLSQIEPVEVGATTYVRQSHRVFAGYEAYARHPMGLVAVALRENYVADALAVD